MLIQKQQGGQPQQPFEPLTQALLRVPGDPQVQGKQQVGSEVEGSAREQRKISRGHEKARIQGQAVWNRK